jgi:hypothetical protein
LEWYKSPEAHSTYSQTVRVEGAEIANAPRPGNSLPLVSIVCVHVLAVAVDELLVPLAISPCVDAGMRVAAEEGALPDVDLARVEAAITAMNYQAYSLLP